MKKIITLLLAVTLCGACSLDETPYNISSEELSESGQGAEQLLTGIYNCFWSTYMMKKTYMEWIDMDHDHAAAQNWVMSGAGEGNVTTHWGYNGNADLWNVFYLMVSRANKAIEALHASDAFADNKKVQQAYGEALFLRSWAYYHLVRMYGPCPLRLTYIQPNDCRRSSVKEVCEQIVADLDEAIAHMSYRSEGNVGDWGHADKTAAQLLLARVLCNMGSGAVAAGGAEMIVRINAAKGDVRFTCDREAVAGYKDFDATACYGRVKKICDEVIGRRGRDFDLQTEWATVWGDVNRRNKELVWGVASADNNDFKTDHLHMYYSIPPYGGNGLYCFMSRELYAQYEQTDDRLIYGVFHYFGTSYTNIFSYGWVPYPDANTYPQSSLPANLSSHTAKWYGNFAKTMPGIAKWYLGDLKNLKCYTAPTGDNAEQDIPLIRFTEAFLLKAEAEIELGDIGAGIDAVNVVRERAHATPYEGISDQTEARSLVLKERALEYVAEFNRKFDLLRWGLYLDVMNQTQTVYAYGAQNSKVRERKNLLYAVPTAELSENTLFGPNNPGW